MGYLKHFTAEFHSECRGFQPLRASHLKSLKIPVFMGFPDFFIFYGILQNQSKIRVFGVNMQVKMQVKIFGHDAFFLSITAMIPRRFKIS